MASKVTPDDIVAMQFLPEYFGPVDDFNTFLQKIIDEQEALLSGRIGAGVMASTTSPTKENVVRAAKCLIAVELFQLRFNRISGDIQNADGLDAFKLRRTQEKYQQEADSLISRLGSGTPADGTGYSGGVVVSNGMTV